jgi:energy-coupling factor transporter ATP-binding protein EcfA2
MKQLKIENFGPIHQADVYFGDLTLLVGPQASGKSIFVQLLKLLIDKQNIKDTFQKFNYVWEKNYDSIISLYFGEGMHKVWHDDSIINLDGRSYRKDFLLPKQGRVDKKDELLFYIPAQRILSVSDGRPKYFTEFDTSTPYVLRQFSETLRLIFQNDIQKNEYQYL